MSRTSPGKTVSKRNGADLRNNKGPAPAASKARSAKDKALRAKTDPVLNAGIEGLPRAARSAEQLPAAFVNRS
jgi:hypothetical protein